MVGGMATEAPSSQVAGSCNNSDDEEDGYSPEEQARKQFASLKRVITISYDNLNRLRHETSSSFVREEIKTLEVR